MYSDRQQFLETSNDNQIDLQILGQVIKIKG